MKDTNSQSPADWFRALRERTGKTFRRAEHFLDHWDEAHAAGGGIGAYYVQRLKQLAEREPNEPGTRLDFIEHRDHLKSLTTEAEQLEYLAAIVSDGWGPIPDHIIDFGKGRVIVPAPEVADYLRGSSQRALDDDAARTRRQAPERRWNDNNRMNLVRAVYAELTADEQKSISGPDFAARVLNQYDTLANGTELKDHDLGKDLSNLRNSKSTVKKL